MSKQKRIVAALINQAYLDPKDFTITHEKGGYSELLHCETGKTIHLNPYETITINGSHLTIWAQSHGISQLNIRNGEWLEVWSRLKDSGEF